MKTGLNEINNLEFAKSEEKLKLKKEFSKKIEAYEKQQYTASKKIAENQIKEQKTIREESLEQIKQQISNEEDLFAKSQLYIEMKKQLENNLADELESIQQKYWLNESERLEEAKKTYKQYTKEIEDVDKKAYETKKALIVKTANEMKTAQLEATNLEINSLEKAYKKQSELIKKVKTEKLDAIKAQSKQALSALEAEQKQQEINYDFQIKNIDDTSKKRIEALQNQIDAITKSATNEDRSYDLGKLEELYNAYSNSATAEGKAKAEELRRQIRDINNDEKIDNLNSEINQIERNNELEKENFKIQYEQKSFAYESQKQQLQNHYDALLSETETHYKDLEEKLTTSYENERNILEAKKYIIEETNKEILENTDKFASENIELYGKNQEDILALLNSKSGSYYASAQSLGKAFYDGLRFEMEKVNAYMQSLSIPNISLSDVNHSYSGNNTDKVSVNNYSLSVNEYGNKNFNDKIDVDSYNKELANTLINKAKFSFGR